MVDDKKTTRNPDSPLFKRLTRLFSGPIVNYRAQAIRRYRRKQLNDYSGKFRSLSGKQFQKSGFNPFQDLAHDMMLAQNRATRYIDFDQMEYTPEIASALDIYADEMTTSSPIQPLLNIQCPNEEIKVILNSLYHNVLNIEHNLFGWCRTMCKYGDFFLYVDLDEVEGIQNVIGLPIKEVERLDGLDDTNPNYVQFQWNSAGLTFENWQVAHFRILGNDKYAPYGTSTLEAARRIWRQLTLLEDAMMSYRIVRSPERRVFYIDVGNMPPEDVEQYMQKVMTQMKRNQLVDETTGRVDLRYNPLSVDEDYFIPVRAGTSSRIESLPGGAMTGDIDDVKYLRDKLFSALKIPASYLSRAEGSDEDKATLAQKDIRFSRTIQRLQRVIVSELEKLGIIHLFTLGYRGNDLISFKLSLNNPSKIAELQELEHWRTKFDVANAALEGYFSKRWVAANLFNISDEEFLRNQRELFYDRMHEAELDAVSESVAGDPTGGGGLGELGGDLDADDDLLDAEVPDEEADLDEPEEPAADDETLLAAPGKKDDKMTTTPASKGKKYLPVDHTGGDRRKAGARHRAKKAKYSDSSARPTKRNLFKGFSELSTLSNMTYEQLESNYMEEEKKLFEVNHEVKLLINELETRKKDENDEVKA